MTRILYSKPTVNLMRQSEGLPVTCARSGLIASPVMKLGDKHEGRAAYIEQLDKDDRVLAMKRSTEL